MEPRRRALRGVARCPETQAAFAEVDRQRALWSKVDYERNAAEFIRDQYAEPALTRERRDRLNRMLARRAAKLSIALAAAARGRG
jgi:hypothetical protein